MYSHRIDGVSLMRLKNQIASGISTVMVAAVGVATVPSLLVAAPRRSTNTPALMTAALSPVVETRYVDDPVYVVVTTPPPDTSTPGDTAAPAGPPPPVGVLSTSHVAPAVPALDSEKSETHDPRPATSPDSAESPRPKSPPAPVAAAPPTTQAQTAGPPPTGATTTTTWPRGTEIPSDWPSGMPIPPIPPGCRKPHLEDNGVWNCER